MGQLQYNNFISVNLQITPITTFVGKKLIFKLSDDSDGQCLILCDNNPQYYFNLLDDDYIPFRNKLKSVADIAEYLERKLKAHDKAFSVKTNNSWGILGKPMQQVFMIEKLPAHFLE